MVSEDKIRLVVGAAPGQIVRRGKASLGVQGAVPSGRGVGAEPFGGGQAKPLKLTLF